MDAIEYLTYQHRELESLFDQIETAQRTRTKLRLCRRLVDLLAVHAAIEEMIFYPAARDAAVEELLPRTFEEHLSLERLVAEIVGPAGVIHASEVKLAFLKARQQRHAAGEEAELFPRVRELLAPGELELLGDRVASVADQLLGPGAGARERITARRAVA